MPKVQVTHLTGGQVSWLHVWFNRPLISQSQSTRISTGILGIYCAALAELQATAYQIFLHLRVKAIQHVARHWVVTKLCF